MAVTRLAVSGVCALALVGVATAQPRPDDKAEADRLFEQGRDLIAKGQRDAGCEKFDLSIRKDPRAVGTMLNLGLCREESGRIATAMALYSEARDRAHDQGLHEHQDAAERKLALLAPRVPHVKITLAPGTPPVRVLIDELVLAADQLADVKVDPGHHVLVVTAPGRIAYEGSFDIAESEHHVAAVPELASGATIVGDNRRATYGKVAMIGGGALVAGGIVLGWVASNQYWDQFPSASRDGYLAHETGKNCWTAPGTDSNSVVRKCNSNGSDALASARRLANVSTGVVIVGGVAAAAGVMLYLLGWTHETAAHVALDVGADHAGVALSGRF